MRAVMAAFRAEWLKLRKRPAVLVLLAVQAVVVLLFGYVFTYLFLEEAASGDLEGAGIDREMLLETLRPAAMPGQVAGLVAGFGGAIGLILGALVVGSEYGWRTVKTMATQRPGRLALVAGRLGALLVVLALLVVAGFLAGGIGTVIIVLFEPGAEGAPALGELATALGAGLLILAVWCALGVLLATVFRGSGLAIGIGLVYVFVIETLLQTLPLRGRAADAVREAMISNNAGALTQTVTQGTEAFGENPTAIDPPQAALVLGAYLVVFLVIGAVLFWRRDIA